MVSLGNVLSAAQTFQNDLGHGGVVVVGQLDLHLALSVVVLTAGGLQIELLDGEVKHQEEHHKGGEAQGEDQPGIGVSGQESREEQVGGAGGEHEAGPEVQSHSDGGEDAVEQSVDNIEREGQEHEGELEGLGNAAKESTDGGGAHDADGVLFLGALGVLDHGQSSAGDTEHHAGEEAGHVHTNGPVGVLGDLAHGEPIGGQVTDTDGIKPEHVVQRVMEAGGDEQTVQESVDTNADHVQTLDGVAHSDQSAKDHRPGEE